MGKMPPPLSSQNWIKGQSQRTHNKGIPSIGKSASFSTVWLSLLCIFNMFKLYISRTFFPSLTLVFSLTPMQWFFRTRPSSGTGPYHLISNISILWQSWNRFRLFTPFTAMAIAPVEAHYSRDLVGDSHHRQKLLFSSRKRTSLITDYQDWVSMLGSPWWTWPGEKWHNEYHICTEYFSRD